MNLQFKHCLILIYAPFVTTILSYLVLGCIIKDLSFGSIVLKIESVVFVYELINYLIIYEIIILYT